MPADRQKPRFRQAATPRHGNRGPSDIEDRAAARLIALAAPARMGKEHQAGAMARLAAWNKRQVQFLGRQAERQGKRLVRKAKGPLAASQ